MACVLNVPGWTRPSLKMILITMMMMMVMMVTMMTMMMTMMTMTMIGCLPGDEDVTWFGDDDPVLPLGQGVEQKREALESLARG